MDTKQPTNGITVDIATCPRKRAQLILSKCQEWGCTPDEAIARLLDMLADDHPNGDANTDKEAA